MGRNIFELSVNIFETVCALGFITLYLGCRHKRSTAVWLFLAFSVIGTVELSLVNVVTVFESIGTYLHLAVFFAYAFFALRGSVMHKLWMCIITQIILTMDAVVTNIGLCCILDYDPNRVITEFGFVRILAIVISKIILVAAYGIIIKSRTRDPDGNSFWYKLVVIPFFSVYAITTLMRVALAYPEMKEYILVGMLCIVGANIMVYYFYTLLRREYENKIRISLLESDNENAKRSIRESGIFVSEMRRVRHDIENHLASIAGLIRNGKSEDALEYIDGIRKNHLPSTLPYISTGCPAFDAVVGTKNAVCKQKGIFLGISAEAHLLDFLSPVDIGVLFGNLLDNAIEGCEKTAEKRIDLEIKNTGSYLSVIISNSISESVLSRPEPFESTKTDGRDCHGIGIKSIRNVVEKYDGIIDYYEQSGQLCCQVSLAIKEANNEKK